MSELMSKPDRRVTAEELEQDCPDELEGLGKRIAAHLEKAHKAEGKADEHYISAAQLLAKAKDVCDEDGFEAFHKKFCPDLGRTRVYEILQIGTGKKTVEEIRGNTRQRVAAYRAKRAASVTVTDKRGSQASGDAPETKTGIIPKDMDCPEAETATKSAPSAKDIGLSDFTTYIARLLQMTKKAKPRRFIKTAIEADALSHLGEFLCGIAKLKVRKIDEMPGTDDVSAEASGEARKAENESRFRDDESSDWRTLDGKCTSPVDVGG